MKALVAPTLVTVSIATVVLCGLAAAPTVHALYEPHRFENIEVSWSDKPFRVDQAAQDYKRLAAAPIPQSVDHAMTLRDPLGDRDTVAQATAEHDSPDLRACRAMHRSYRVEDNTYQPFDGGPRRACAIAAPGVAAVDAPRTVTSSQIAAGADVDSKVSCAARYSSYNSKDGTYQPFGGGPRRSCVSIGGLAWNG